MATGKIVGDRQWENRRRKGLSDQTRFWIDDMYMITILQVQAFRATGDSVYLDRAAFGRWWLTSTNCNGPMDCCITGQIFHSSEAGQWLGRDGHGGVVALPAGATSQRVRIMASYRKMMAALQQYQDADGMWHQLIDGPDSYKETSCTAMFTYAMITGVRRGWLPEKPYAGRPGRLARTDGLY